MDKPTVSSGTRYGVPAHRDKITGRLGEAYAQNMLDQQEFERRVELAERSQTIEELELLVADFGTKNIDPMTPGHRHLVVMSEQTHQLQPGQEQSFHGVAVMGHLIVDLRAFRGSGTTLLVTVSGCMSEINIKVPKGTVIVRKSRTIMGEFKTILAGQAGVLVKLWKQLVGTRDLPPPSPFPAGGPPPTIILQGTLVMGSLSVREDAN